MTNEDDSLLQLPSSWTWTTIGEISSPIKGKKPKILGNRNETNSIPYVNIMAFEKKIITQYTDGANCPLCKATDILVVWDGARCGLVGSGSEGAIGSTLAKLVFSEIDGKYLFHFLKSKFEYINKKPRGVGIPHVDPNLFWAIQFPLAPLQEQKRISLKVEELFSFLDAGTESLRKVQAQLKRYRQAVLKAAFEGKLTEEWRKTHKDQIEPAPKFLEKVKQDLKRATPNKLAELGLNNESGFQELPETWVWATIGELETFIGSGITPRGGRTVYVQEGIPFIRSQNVYPDGLRLEEIAYVTPKMHDTMKRTKAYPNDVLLNITGASIGRSAVIPEKLPEANVNQHVCIIRTGWWLIPAYLSHFLNSPIGQTQIFGTQSGVTRQGLNYEQVRRLKIQLAPLMEQNEIVTKIEATYTATGQVEKTIRQNINHVEYLRQSILKDAFGGKLVPQDSDDEPAEKLLERIKAEHISNRTPKFSNQLELSRYVK